LWQNVFLEWERCNILDGFGNVPTRPPKSIRKFAFNYLENVKETQFKKLVKGLFEKMITLKECTQKGGKPELKYMYKFTRFLKQDAMIQIEKMIHFGHPKPTTNNQKLYLDVEWHTLKEKHNFEKMLFLFWMQSLMISYIPKK
jgi:hypothetical protein